MNIIGHKKIIDLLEKSIQEDKISHAYLFSGPEKVGKYAVALQFANKITENNEKYNADIKIIYPETEEKMGVIKKRDINIESVRELGRWLSLSPLGKRKVAIVDEADHLNVMAQNALLKTLEESVSGSMIILVSQDEKKLLPTVFSRCHQMKFGTVSDQVMRLWIEENGKRLEEEMLFWSLGRPGMLIDFLRDKSLWEARKEAVKEFWDIIGKNLHERFFWAEISSKNVPESISKLNLWLIILRKCLLETNLAAPLSREKALRGIIETEKSLRTLRETNSQARLVLENLLLIF